VIRPALKLTAYFEERDRGTERLLADELFDVYEHHRMRSSLLLRGVLGFGSRHELHSDRLLTMSESLPAVSMAIDTTERIERALPDVLTAARGGLITLERAQLRTDAGVPELPSDTLKLTIYGGRGIRAHGEAGYVVAVQALKAAGASAVSVLLGVDGTLHGERRRARFFARNAGVPLMLVAIGEGSRLAPAWPQLASLIEDPVVSVERVQICKADGMKIADPEAVASKDEAGLPIWQQITVYADEQAHVHRRPLHVELIRALSEAGAPGATALRGVRGFYGNRGPFSDRVLSIRRNAPIQIVVIDHPVGVRRWWPVLDELTAEHGLVTSEVVPASRGRHSTQLALAQPPG
jgi:PII-like signaling protein